MSAAEVMSANLHPTSKTAQAGDLAQMVAEGGKSFIIRLEPGASFQSHLGVIEHDVLIGQEWGSQVKTHLDKDFLLLQPALDDLLRQIKRETQIMYPKDIGYLLVTMGIGPGMQIIEAGSGSGALTTALAYSVGPSGYVYSYEWKQRHLEIASDNLELFGLADRVTFTLRDIKDGFDQNDAEAVFLDLPDPDRYISQTRQALAPGGFFGSVLPTTGQVSDLITALKRNNFGFIEVSEILHRYYKASATRFRPVDQMVAHTGYLIFARKVSSLRPKAAEEE